MSYNIDHKIEVVKNRMFLVVCVILFGYSVLIFRLINMAFIFNNVKISKNNDSSDVFLIKRSDILDRNGVLLAGNIPTASIYINPKQIRDSRYAIKALHQILPDLDKKALVNAFNSDKSFVWIKRHLVPKEQEKILKIGLPGLYLVADERRVYPHNSLFAHILGYTDTDSRGLAGVERYFDSVLRKNNNESLTLSVDVRLQYIIRNILVDAVKQYKAAGAAVVLLNINNCEILSMSSLPDFDINNPKIAKENELFNRISLGLYEMGSIFKSFIIASALDSKSINIDDVFEVKDGFKIADKIIHDIRPRNGKMTIDEIFMHSSNIGTIQIAAKIGQELQFDYLKKMGLFDPLSIEIAEKATPIFPKKDKWNNITSATVSYGYGVSVTPIHMVEGIASIVGDGCRCRATLIKNRSIDNKEKILDRSTTEIMKYLFNVAVQRGTGMRAIVPRYEISGKTGSANKVVDGSYNNDIGIASFVAIFPSDDPKYLLFIMIDEPKRTDEYKNITGGYVAAPIAGKIVEKIAPLLGISPL